MLDQLMDGLAEDFQSRLVRPTEAARRMFILGVIGQTGSGKSAVAELLRARLRGSVVVCADSARFLLREKGLSWGDNVRALVLDATDCMVTNDYGVIIDGSTAEVKERRKIQELGRSLGAHVFFVRVKTQMETCKKRLKAKYNDPTWQSSFERFRVNTLEKMLLNLEDQQPLHDKLMNGDIDQLVGVIENEGSLTQLEDQVERLVQGELRAFCE